MKNKFNSLSLLTKFDEDERHSITNFGSSILSILAIRLRSSVISSGTEI